MSSRSMPEWREADFEKWFAAYPLLPGGERLLIVSRHEPIRRMVDITAVDAQGGIVVIEVKNEKAHRVAIGQALEYLAHLDSVSFDDLEDDFADFCGGDLRGAFHATYGVAAPALSSRRRVYLVAPTHDTYTSVCAAYLSTCLAGHNVQFSASVEF